MKTVDLDAGGDVGQVDHGSHHAIGQIQNGVIRVPRKCSLLATLEQKVNVANPVHATAKDLADLAQNGMHLRTIGGGAAG